MNFSPTPGKLYLSEDEKSKAITVLSEAKENWKKNNNSAYKAVNFFESKTTKTDDSF